MGTNSRMGISTKKLVSYLLFIGVGIKRGVKTGQALSFLEGETRAKLQRLQNKDRIGEIRKTFDMALPSDYIYNPLSAKLENVHVFSLCHGQATPEQKLSILSFLCHVGTPAKWSIVSDRLRADPRRMDS
jgi:hypothetical protein